MVMAPVPCLKYTLAMAVLRLPVPIAMLSAKLLLLLLSGSYLNIKLFRFLRRVRMRFTGVDFHICEKFSPQSVFRQHALDGVLQWISWLSTNYVIIGL